MALLLAVELLAHGPRSRQHTETDPATPVSEQSVSETETTASVVVRDSETDTETAYESDGETAQVITLAGVSPRREPAAEPTAQEVMWDHFRREQAQGRTPTGAELDRIAGTNNYGRMVLRQWREQGRIPPDDQELRMQGGMA